jgi:DNA-binding transcriptional MerR regulator
MATEARGAKASSGKMTIGELAQRTGMTIRNIRAHQTRGLLPPPEVQGRTGYYNEEHVARIELTREMQAEGLNLETIRRVLESTGGSSKEMVDFARAVRAPFEDESPEIYEPGDFAAAWNVESVDERLLRRAEKLGVLRVLADGNIEVISPRLHLAAKLHEHADAVARAYIDLFTEQIWGPFDKAGRPDEDWHTVLEALEAMRPLASDALLAMFQITMGEETEKAAERTLRNAGKPPARGRSGRPRKRR